MKHVDPAVPRGEVSGVMAGLGAWVLRHRRWVIVGWLVVLVAGGAAAGSVSKRLSFDFSLPGQPGYETAKQVTATWGNGGATAPSIIVATPPAGTTARAQEARVGAAFAALRSQTPRARVIDYGVTHDPAFFTNDGRTTYALVLTAIPSSFSDQGPAKALATGLEQALPGWQVGVTGLEQLSTGGDTKGPGVLAETLFGAAGALCILAFVFASFLALVPMLIAAVSILTTLLVVLGLTYLTDVSFIVQFLVSLVGLGVAIDYSLLLVTRWREERAHGADNATAVVTAVSTAGRAVLLSGLTVAIGLVALVVLPVPGLRSVGFGGMLIPLVSVAVTTTLLPAMLGGIGPRIDWPRIRHEDRASRVWSGWARIVTRRPLISAGLAAAALAVLIVPVFSLTVGQTSPDALARTGAAHDAYQRLLDGGVPGGVLTPVEVLTRPEAASNVRQRLSAVPGITAAMLPGGVTGTKGGTSEIIALPAAATVNSKSLEPLRAVKSALRGDPGVVGVTGVGAIQQDYSSAVFGHFPLMFALIAVATFLLLARAFRSVLLAAKAVALNLLSLAATFGLLTWFWQQGHGSQAIFGVPATGAITFWLPLMVFAFLFGLSMDYEVFILTRMREEYDRTGSTRAAVIEGLGRTGRLVTSAALILFLAFASLASAPNTDIKVLATGLGAGILLDATIVRAVLVPALVTLFGRWNWVMPRWLGRALFLPPEPRLAAVPAGAIPRQELPESRVEPAGRP